MTRKKKNTTQPEITIMRQHRKSLVMRVSAAGEILVHIPRWMKPNHPMVEKFIEDALQKLGDLIPVEKTLPLHNANSIRRMVYHWAARMGLQVGRVQFRDMIRKWGSCSNRGNITLNTALFYLPEHLVEYVVAHELTHMMVFDHSPAFWAKLSEYVPNCKAFEQELERYRV